MIRLEPRLYRLYIVYTHIAHSKYDYVSGIFIIADQDTNYLNKTYSSFFSNYLYFQNN